MVMELLLIIIRGFRDAYGFGHRLRVRIRHLALACIEPFAVDFGIGRAYLVDCLFAQFAWFGYYAVAETGRLLELGDRDVFMLDELEQSVFYGIHGLVWVLLAVCLLKKRAACQVPLPQPQM